MVACTGTAAFDTASVGAGKTVTVSGLTLTGAAAGNYALSSTTATTTAAITAATVTPAITAANKVVRRDDERDADELHGDGRRRRRCRGVHGHGGVRYRDASGAGKTVTASGLTLTGAAAGNYVLASTTATTTAAITGADGHAGGHGGEQGVRRHDQRDADELHGDGRARRRRGGCTGTAAFDTASVGHGQDGDGRAA